MVAESTKFRSIDQLDEQSPAQESRYLRSQGRYSGKAARAREQNMVDTVLR